MSPTPSQAYIFNREESIQKIVGESNFFNPHEDSCNLSEDLKEAFHTN